MVVIMYKKGNEIKSKVSVVELNGYTIFNPSAEQIKEAGWEEYVAPTPTPKTIDEQNEEIRLQRQAEYQQRSDSLYMAYVKYVEQGELEKAEVAKANWLAEIAKIDEEYPYIVAE